MTPNLSTPPPHSSPALAIRLQGAPSPGFPVPLPPTTLFLSLFASVGIVENAALPPSPLPARPHGALRLHQTRFSVGLHQPLGARGAKAATHRSGTRAPFVTRPQTLISAAASRSPQAPPVPGPGASHSCCWAGSPEVAPPRPGLSQHLLSPRQPAKAFAMRPAGRGIKVAVELRL